MSLYLDDYKKNLDDIIKIQESIISNIKLNVDFDLNYFFEKRQQLVTTLLSIPISQEEKNSFKYLKDKITNLEYLIIEEAKKMVLKAKEEEDLHIRNQNKMIRYFKTLLQNAESSIFDSMS